MAQAARNLGLSLLIAGPAFASAPAVRGAYYGDLGTLQLETQEGRVSAHYERGGSCAFDPERRVLEGTLEGDVLVGTVTLCQVGAACKEHVYPLLAFFNPQDGTLSADIKLESGCNSPALRGSRLLLKTTPGAESVAGHSQVGAAVKKRYNPKHNADLARKAFATGQRLLKNNDYAGAKGYFEVALSYDEKNWVGYLALGVAEVSLNHPQRALDAYERAIELKSDSSDTYYNMACAYAKLGDRAKTLEHLRQAVKLGFNEPDVISADNDLTRVLGDDPELRELIAKASALKAKQARANKHGGI